MREHRRLALRSCEYTYGESTSVTSLILLMIELWTVR